MWCDVMWCDVMWCDVMWCDVMWCDVTWCDVMWCDVMWCDVMWCDVMWCDVMWCDVMWCDAMLCDVISCDAMWCDVMWCDVMWFSRQTPPIPSHPSNSPLCSSYSAPGNTRWIGWSDIWRSQTLRLARQKGWSACITAIPTSFYLSIFLSIHLSFFFSSCTCRISSYSILHSEDSILRQMKVGQSKLHLFPSAALRQGMEAYMADLAWVRALHHSAPSTQLPLKW